MTEQKKFRMEVECNRYWESMKPVSCGHFCSVCNKVVHDLRSEPYDEIMQLRQQERICGIFLLVHKRRKRFYVTVNSKLSDRLLKKLGD